MAFGLTLLLTGYSFTWDILDYLTIAIIAVFPVVKFFSVLKPTWVKVTVSVFSLIGICIAGYYIIIYVAFYTAGDKEKMQNWSVDNFDIELTHRQDWAGPTYYRYDLKRTIIFGIFEKTLAQNYPGTNLSDTCIVDFKKFYNYGDPVYTFDKCEQTIKELK